MSRRNRSRTLTKANGMGNSPAVRGTTWTTEQVAAILQRTVPTAGGQAAMPLPRLEPMVPFGPGIPLVPAPINPINPATGRAEPRAYEYPVAYNLPGFGERLVPWKVLRDAADMIPLFRRCIEIRKAEVATLDWDVTISAKAIERAQRADPNVARSDVEKGMRERVDPHIGRLVDFWEQPDPRNGHDFIAWASKLLEEYFVLDAISVYPRMRRSGDLFGFEILDGTTIKPLLDADGFRPMAPQPAFQQILYGFPRGEFVADGEPDPDLPRGGGFYPADRLVYKVHNVRSWTPYGFSAVEQALTDGELYLRRLGWLKAEYTDGVMPAGWLLSGEGQAEWSPQMLAQYERELNDYYAGNTVARQRYRILPWGMKPDAAKSDLGERYKPDYDLHLIKLVGSHFDTTIAELGFTETGGLGSTGWHEGQADVQDRKATQPTLRRLQAFCTHLMRTFLGAPAELEFRILGLESEDEDAADEVADRRVKGGRMTLNEDRDRTGLPRFNFKEADMAMLDTGRGVVFLEGASDLAAAGTMVGPPQPALVGAPQEGQPGEPGQPGVGAETPPNPDAVKAELVAYRRWLAKGRTSRPFRFETLSKADAAAAGVQLDKAEFAEGVAGRAPKVRHWPGWDRDLAVAEYWAPLLHQALTGAPNGPLRLAGDFVSQRIAPGVDAARSWLATRHLPIASSLALVLEGLWTDGYFVGAVSARTMLSHHGIVVKADADVATVTLGADWGAWTPGDWEAARELLGVEGLGDGLAALLEHGGIILKGIEDTKLDQLARILANGVTNGDAPAKIAQSIRALVDDAKWAYRVALTETTRAVSSATLARYWRNGVEAKEWMTAGDQHVCVPCNVNEDVGAVALESPFPDGNDAPPSHPLCRCSLAPAWLTADEAAAQGAPVPPSDAEMLAEIAARQTARLDEIITTQHQQDEELIEGIHERWIERFGLPGEIAEPGIGPTEAELAADPALKMRVAELKRLAADNDVPLYRATTKRDIIWQIRQWESDRLKSGGKVLLPDGPIGKPITFKPEPIVAPPLGVPSTTRKVLSGSALNDWADSFKYDLQHARHEFVDAAGNTAAEGVRVRDLRTLLGNRAEGIGDYVVTEGTAWRFDGVAYLVEHGPNDYGAPWVSRALQELRDAHAAIPAAGRANRSYTVLSGRNPSDQYWARTFNNPNHRAAMSAGDGHINIWGFIGRVSRADVDMLRHETGHNLDTLLGGRHHGVSGGADWLKAADKDAISAARVRDLKATHHEAKDMARVEPGRGFPKGVTRYGRSSGAEDYAESVMLYQLGPIAEGVLPGEASRLLWFRDIYPARAKLLDVQFPEIAKAQKQAIADLKAAAARPAPVDLSKLKVADLRALAAERGITVPARALKRDLVRLLNEPVPPTPTLTPAEVRAAERRAVREAARERNRLIESSQGTARLLAEVDELVAKGATQAALRERLDVALIAPEQVFANADPAVLASLRRALETGDMAKLRSAITRAGTKVDIKAIGKAGAKVKFDPATMEPAAGVEIKAGAQVQVVRRGSTLALPDGTVMQLEKARVTSVAKPVEVPKPAMPSRHAMTAHEIMDWWRGTKYSTLDAAAQDAILREFDRAVAAVIDGDYGNGITVRLGKGSNGATVSSNFLGISGDILNAQGRKVGKFYRTISQDRKTGEWGASHSYLHIARTSQGSGFAERFNANLYDWYRRSGITRVTITANEDVGGYAWAVRGFDFADQVAATKFLERARETIQTALKRTPRGLTRDQVRQLADYIERVWNGDVPARALDIATFGRQPGQGGKDAIWAGKWLMMKNYWNGVLEL